jgi:DNA invertase Pin-like site-specific DNA recombinase
MGDILGYTRASTGDIYLPEDTPWDIAGQTTRLSRAGALKVFCDRGSDRAMHRPGLDGLLSVARTGDTVAVVRLDRLGRTITELLATVVALTDRGIALVCLDEKIDTRTADGALILHLFATIAHCERQLAIERTQTGSASAVARGKRRGRPPLDTDKVTAALRLVESGLSPAAAARQLRLGRSTIYREVSRACIERTLPSHGG